MKISFGFYPGNKRRALTMSYDDSRCEDRRLVEIFNENGIKGTFHIISSRLGNGNYLTYEEIGTLFRGHEVSGHTLTHPQLTKLPTPEIIHEVLEDRKILESACHYPVRGLSYPYGNFSDDVVNTLRTLGVCYSRTTKGTQGFAIPDDFLLWHPTCHHRMDIFALLESFKTAKPLSLFYVWGHSFEFPRDNNWEKIEEFCKRASEEEDVWFATNIEIYDYITALRNLVFSADRTMVFNPSALDVILDVDGEPVEIPSGKTVTLK